jgi:hypothetical protein
VAATTHPKSIEFGAAFRFALTWFSSRPLALLVIALPGSLFAIATALLAERSDLAALSFLVSIAGLFVAEITAGALTFAIFMASTDRPVTPVSSYEHVYDRLGTLVAYLFRYFGAILLLSITIVGIPWGIRLAVRWFFGVQAVILTNANSKEAISHSCRLVNSVWWQVFLSFFALLPIAVLNIALTVGWPRGLAAGLIGAALSLATAPIFAGYWTAIYLQLDRHEAAAPPLAPEAL